VSLVEIVKRIRTKITSVHEHKNNNVEHSVFGEYIKINSSKPVFRLTHSFFAVLRAESGEKNRLNQIEILKCH
jgi:hypothetical protein